MEIFGIVFMAVGLVAISLLGSWLMYKVRTPRQRINLRARKNITGVLEDPEFEDMLYDAVARSAARRKQGPPK